MPFPWPLRRTSSTHWLITEADHTWEIRDLAGTIAWYRTVIDARCQANGIFAWRDTITGTAERIAPEEYVTPKGHAMEIRDDVDGYLVLVHLDNTYNKGDTIRYEAGRPVKNAFAEDGRGWVAISILDSMHGPAHMTVLFPPGAEVTQATLQERSLGYAPRRDITSSIQRQGTGPQQRFKISLTVRSPRTGATYAILWKWNGGQRPSQPTGPPLQLPEPSPSTLTHQQRAHTATILHISDIHLGTATQAKEYVVQLEADLRRELHVNSLDYVVVSGDIADRSTPDEYEAGVQLLTALSSKFEVPAPRIIAVPGNHDLNWDLSEQAYDFVHRHRIPVHLDEQTTIRAGDAGALFRNDERYKLRFAHFSTAFYSSVFSDPYPLESDQQAMVRLAPIHKMLFLALNTSWEVDHHFVHRASANTDALSIALDTLSDDKYSDWLKLATWHHPVIGPDAMNPDFLQLLAVHGFQIVLNGHIHESAEYCYRYDPKRSIHIVGAGTFGAPSKYQVAGVPLQYNLLLLNRDQGLITVETRRKEKQHGAWSADARWGDKNNPQPRYTISLGASGPAQSS